MKADEPKGARSVSVQNLFLLYLLVLEVGCTRHPAEGILLVTSGGTDYVFVMDAASGHKLDSLAVDPRPGEGDEPHGITISPTRDFWYVTVAHGEPALWKFTWPGNRRVGRLRLGLSGASRIGISPDGGTAYIPDYYRDDPTVMGRIGVVRVHDLEVIARPSVCIAPHDAQVSTDGRRVAVACSGGNELVFMSTSDFTVTRRVSLGTEAGNARPMNVVWLPGDTAVVATLHQTAELVRYLLTEDRIERVRVGAGPAQLALGPDGQTVVTANRMDGTASIVSLESMEELARVALHVAHPHGVVLSEDGDIAFVTYEGATNEYGGVLALDILSRSVIWDVPAGAFTLGVTYVTHE